MSSHTKAREMTPAQKRDEAMRGRVEQSIAEHEMTVLRDDGLYRHLRFQKPGTSIYWFDLITWPGVLAVSGDCGAFMFSRITDMLEFFESSHGEINPGYWSEKLRAPGQRDVQVYSEEVFREQVAQWVEDVTVDLDEDEAAALRQAVQEQVLDDPDGYLAEEGIARLRLHEFEHDGHHMSDTWEWRLWEYDAMFLWCCWAIVKGIEKYRAATPAAAPKATAA